MRAVLAAALLVAAQAFDFNVTDNNYDYAEALRLTTRFYGAQRCGPNSRNWLFTTNPTNRRDCHRQDGATYGNGIDLNGGWHDAGDHIKFTLTIAYTAMTLLKGFDAFPTAYLDRDSPDYSGVPNGIPDILDEVRYATDWLIKAHVSTNVLISRVGGDQDHNNFFTAPTQTTQPPSQGGDPRPVYGGGNGQFNSRADIAGTAAAALAQMSRLYRPYSATYANTCLARARQIHDIAKANRAVTPQPGDNFYGKRIWLDSLTCGAVELFRATNEQAFLTEALGFDNGAAHGWVVDWGTHWDWCRHSLAKAGQLRAGWRTDVTRYVRTVADVQYTRGLAYFSDWGSLRYALNSAFSTALLWEAEGRTNATLRNFALSQLNYALGTNEYGRSFVIGFGTNPPVRPHHASAFGRDRWPSSNTESHLFVLRGAMVGGPTRNQYRDGSGNLITDRGYQDWTLDYVGNEVTIDYNAALVGLAAFAVRWGATDAVVSDAVVSDQ